ncbi:hypothetical protein U9M48_034753 [Paspalum notatum var. saurae]|uniref:Jacalin-type lectin domain-containing protein n=1 Tax=Paspalum notatum var. saurae TaxID=547442 RepID=A0AAQ3UBI6_PASNO
MAKHCVAAAAVLLLVGVTLGLGMYTCGLLLVGVQLGRVLERRPPPDSASRSIGGVLDLIAKVVIDNGNAKPAADRRCLLIVTDELQELWDTDVAGRGGSSRDARSPASNKPRGVISVGPWGGSGGEPFYMHGPSAPRLRRIVLYHSPSAIHSLDCAYSLAGDGDDRYYYRRAGPWGRRHRFGSSAPFRETIELSAGERVTAVEGTTGHFTGVGSVVVTSLIFRTSRGMTYGQYGAGAGACGTPFSVPVADGACIAGFWGRSGWLLDAIGVHVSPCKNPAHVSRSYSKSEPKRAAAPRAQIRTLLYRVGPVLKIR